MRTYWKWLLRIAKVCLALAIIGAVGWRFANDLRTPSLWDRSFRPGWLLLSGLLYLLALSFSAWFWYRLMRSLNQQPNRFAAIRAYYISQLGKYVPGKALALAMRATMVRSPSVKGGIAALAGVYEVLTTMAAGCSLAAILFAGLQSPSADFQSPSADFQSPSAQRGGSSTFARRSGSDTDARALAGRSGSDVSSSDTLVMSGDWAGLRRLIAEKDIRAFQPDRGVLVIFAIGLLLPVGLPLIPTVFNRLVHYMSLPFRRDDAAPSPRLHWRSLAEGLSITSVNWLLFGISLWAAIQGVLTDPLAWSWEAWGRYIAYMGIAYVAGFVIPVPGGLGVREVLLTFFLVHELNGQIGGENTQAVVELIVVVLRLVWTAAEVVMAGILYPLARWGYSRLDDPVQQEALGE